MTDCLTDTPHVEPAEPTPAPAPIWRVGTHWTTHTIEWLRTMLADGRSGAECAAELSRHVGYYVSRNTVIGIAHRRGLTFKNPHGTRPKRPHGQDGALASAIAHRRYARAPVRAPRARPPRPEPQPYDPTLAIPFPRASMTGCAWPLWDDATPAHERTVCGAPTVSDVDSWCHHHARRAWSEQ